MSLDDQHIALPKLMGAPAYARPPRPVAPTPRPLDLDDLPIEAARTSDDVLALLEVAPAPGNGHGPAPAIAPAPPIALTSAIAPAPSVGVAPDDDLAPGPGPIVPDPDAPEPGDARSPAAAAAPGGRPFSLKGLSRYLSGK